MLTYILACALFDGEGEYLAIPSLHGHNQNRVVPFDFIFAQFFSPASMLCHSFAVMPTPASAAVTTRHQIGQAIVDPR